MARVLIIEDKATNLELAQRLLEQGGHRVMVATDGRTGLAVARRERLDLIICDLQMPELEGHAVLEQLRIDAACAQIPIVAVTAFSMADEGQKARLAGFDGYFSKPIEARTFVAELEAFLR